MFFINIFLSSLFFASLGSEWSAEDLAGLVNERCSEIVSLLFILIAIPVWYEGFTDSIPSYSPHLLPPPRHYFAISITDLAAPNAVKFTRIPQPTLATMPVIIRPSPELVGRNTDPTVHSAERLLKHASEAWSLRYETASYFCLLEPLRFLKSCRPFTSITNTLRSLMSMRMRDLVAFKNKSLKTSWGRDGCR